MMTTHGICPWDITLEMMKFDGRGGDGNGEETTPGQVQKGRFRWRIGNLHDNQIRADGAESIARVLVQCAAFTHLNLNCNETGTGGATCRSVVTVNSAGSPRSQRQ